MYLTLLVLLGALANAAPATFGDADLEQTVRTTGTGQRRAIIYGWSPHMPLSVRGLRQLLGQGRHHHIEIVPVLDPGANETLSEQVRRREGWPEAYLRRAASPRLIAMGFRMHYPTYLLIGHGRLVSHLLPGYKTPSAMSKYLRKLQ